MKAPKTRKPPKPKIDPETGLPILKAPRVQRSLAESIEVRLAKIGKRLSANSTERTALLAARQEIVDKYQRRADAITTAIQQVKGAGIAASPE